MAIARKYRPATFEEIVGQSHVTRTLRNAIAQNRIHHAFLFTGARGVGKTTAARALARSLNCSEGPTENPCGKCTSCLEVVSGSSPDLIEIDGASNNSVDDIREIREAVRYAPTGGGWKIYLIDEVHMLSKGAFNALLKTLEEPPAHVLFIFATTEPNRIPDTILSRVQRFDFKRIPVPAIVARLNDIATSEAVTISEVGLRLIAEAGEGSMRDAQSLLDQVISYAGNDIQEEHVVECLGLIDRTLLYTMLSALIQGKPEQCLEQIHRAYANGYDLVRFSEELLEVLRNATFVRLSEGARKHVDLPEDEMVQLLDITKDADSVHLSRLFSALLDTHDRVSRANRPKVILEMAVARLADIRPTHPISALIERLEDLERRLSDGSPRPPSRGGNRPSGGGSRATRGTEGYSNRSGKTQALATEAPRANIAQSEPTSAPHLTLVVNEPEPVQQKEPETPKEVSPWAQFIDSLDSEDMEMKALLSSTFLKVDGTQVHIQCTAGRTASMAKRAMQNPKVQTAFLDMFGAKATIHIKPVKPLRALTQTERLMEEVKRAPAIIHLEKAFQVDITKIITNDDGEAQ